MLINDKYQKLNWNKNKDGLIPAIIQHIISGEILMMGYMNKDAIIKTEKTGKITFFSRSKQRLWTKGETSGNILKLISWHPDCDNDTLLIFVLPDGPTCHQNKKSCFHSAVSDFTFLYQLENIISQKKHITRISNSSYTSRLYMNGIKRIAQKVGEEGLETAIAAVSCEDKELINEISDLIYHILVLLQYKSLNFNKVIQELKSRNNTNKKTQHNNINNDNSINIEIKN